MITVPVYSMKLVIRKKDLEEAFEDTFGAPIDIDIFSGDCVHPDGLGYAFEFKYIGITDEEYQYLENYYSEQEVDDFNRVCLLIEAAAQEAGYDYNTVMITY